jgi:hypothetical protein
MFRPKTPIIVSTTPPKIKAGPVLLLLGLLFVALFVYTRYAGNSLPTAIGFLTLIVLGILTMIFLPVNDDGS